MDMFDIFIGLLFIIPLYGILIWSYYCPEDSLLWGKRWMYKEEPEISDSAIRYTKVTSLIGMIAIPLFFIFFIVSRF
ncbi:MAG: hypothetical protein K6T94_17280 [Paenibacillus sp.]|nr:hypothetical protein [Paenibacillus sp.]